MVALRIQNLGIREFLAELLGSTILLCLGCSSSLVFRLNNPEVSTFFGPFAWGMALTVAIYVSGGVSGGHLNPAVTLGLATVGKFKWSSILRYFGAQYIGAFLGTSISYIVYHQELESFQKSNNSIMNIYATNMISKIDTGSALVDQIISTAFFVLTICAILDKNNMNVPKALQPIAIGFINLSSMLFSFGHNCGGPLNPARDLAPRLFSIIFFNEDFNTKYFWIPIIGCHVGAIIGCWIYKLIIENHWPDELQSYYSRNENNDNNNNNNCSIHVTSE